MIEETARVVSVAADMAEVETARRSACGGCSAQSGCGTALIGSMFGNRRSRLQVANPIHARPGEQVVVGLSERPFLRAAFAVYAVPLLALIGGALAGEWLVAGVAGRSAELGGLGGGLSGLSAGLAWLWLFSRRTRRESAYRAVILRRAGPQDIAVPLP